MLLIINTNFIRAIGFSLVLEFVLNLDSIFKKILLYSRFLQKKIYKT